MSSVAIVTGLTLICIGLAGYFLPEATSPTALIPVAIGLLFVLLGALARREDRRKHMMHAAALLAILAIAATVTAIPIALKALQGEEVERPLAAYAKAGTALVCMIFTLLAIRSFVAARAARLRAS